jgi:hypothetical protein
MWHGMDEEQTARQIEDLKVACKVGFEMRKSQRAFFASKGKDRDALIESKRLEAAFDVRLGLLGYK